MIGAQIFGLTLLFVFIGYLLGSILFGDIVSKLKKVDLRGKGSGNVGATNALRIMGKTVGFTVMILDFFKSWLSCFLCLIIYKYTMPLIDSNLYSDLGVIVYLSGTFSVIGHCFPIMYLIVLFKTKFDFKEANKYSGGKGVSTAAGLMAAVSPWIFFTCFILFFTTVFISKYVSLSSILAISLIPIMSLIPWMDYLYLMDVIDANILPIPSIDKAYEISNTISYSKNIQYILVLFFSCLVVDFIVIFRHRSNIVRLINKNENKIFKKKV